MKKLLPILLMLCFSLAGNAQNKGFKIKMKIEGMKESPCYLINYFGVQRYYKDTANFNKDGVVVFEGKEHHPGGIYAVYTGGKILFEFVINGEPIVELETDTLDYINNMVVKKSEENKVFFEHLKFINEKQKESDPLRKKASAEGISDKEKENCTIMN